MDTLLNFKGSSGAGPSGSHHQPFGSIANAFSIGGGGGTSGSGGGGAENPSGQAFDFGAFDKLMEFPSLEVLRDFQIKEETAH